MMTTMTKSCAVLLAACMFAEAKPGELDRRFQPELRAWVAPERVSIAPDGRAWIGGGFDQGDGYSTGDLLRLGENGGVESEPAPGYLKTFRDFAWIGLGTLIRDGSPFFLTSGGFLLPGETGGWLRMSAAGEVLGKAFPDRMEGEEIIPQFEADGKLWTIRKLANGQRVLELRNSADGSLDPGFTWSADLPRNVNDAVPAPDGGAWVQAGDAPFWLGLWSGKTPQQQILNVDATGSQRGTAMTFTNSRSMDLSARTGGAFRIKFGPDLSRWMYWPAPTSATHTLEWFSADGIFERRISFQVSLENIFTWDAGEDGSLLATTGKGSLMLYGPGETTPQYLTIFNHVRSVKALPDGKWLIDGLYRLNADGSEDESWQVPELSTPAQVTALVPMPDGLMLAGGNFAMADGIVRNRLVVFRKDGAVDPSFIPDERIGEWRSVVVAKQAIYVVTAEPVSYGEMLRSNLVKLRMDGTLDENYQPGIFSNFFVSLPPVPVLDNAYQVHASDGGDILVETFSNIFGVAEQSIYRLKPDGSRDPAFQIIRFFQSFATVMPLKSGGFVRSGIIYRKDGMIERDLTKPGVQFDPLCEHLGGVLFQETDSSGSNRLRLWNGRAWDARFRAPALDGAREIVAESGERDTLHISATLADERPVLLRLHSNGRLDRSFRQPSFGHRMRSFAGDWWTAEEGGRVAFDPAKEASASAPQTLVWESATRRLWVGGNFNVVDAESRDGLARIIGGFARGRR